jgi:ribonuclease HII
MAPGAEYEQAFFAQEVMQVAGLDEAGRGCWAGPVVAAAVVFPPTVLAQPAMLDGINDSKALTANQREVAYALIHSLALGVGVGCVPAYLIDAYGIVPATRLAMTIALLSLPCLPQALLIDALPLPAIPMPQTVLIRGDSRSLSIAAASIIAKVTRDRLMQTAETAYPGYGFAAHKGYGTATHHQALLRLGPCALHRHTFQPLLDLQPEL